MCFLILQLRVCLESQKRLNFQTVLRVRKTIETFEVALNAFYIILWPRVYGGQGVECSGLNVNGPHRLMLYNTLSPTLRNVWEESKGVAFLEEVCH